MDSVAGDPSLLLMLMLTYLYLSCCWPERERAKAWREELVVCSVVICYLLVLGFGGWRVDHVACRA